ncbi:hypothetical protein LCGC14_2873680 [marine sediment metagenome]|uniref:PD-(D/E)XK endonuclease-like domain-containing protein n=1 Tax=marine sediment metagenome TaxID=412755 RepID=A0A0F9AAE2_9ZZZZ
MTEPTTYFWSHFDTWVECPERYRTQYILKEPYDIDDNWAVKEGREIHSMLANRLEKLATNKGFKAGNSLLLKKYHALYGKEDSEMTPWRTEVTLPGREIAPGILIAGRVDAMAPNGLIRDTKRKGRRYGLAKDMLQLMWYCLCAGTNRGQLDLVYPPAWERTEWGMERLNYTFSKGDFSSLITDIATFHEEVKRNSSTNPVVAAPRNHNSCHYCPYTNGCWPNLIVK